MTNLEKYYDKLTDYYGINKKTEKVMLCEELRCIECMFRTNNGECLEDRFNLKSFLIWLNKEHKEPYKITPEELAFCNMVHTGTLWRDDCEQLMYSRLDYNKTFHLDLKIFPSFTFVHNDTLIDIEDILNNYVLKEPE